MSRFQLFAECRQADRGGVIFIPDVLSVWDSLDTTQGSALLLQLWRTRAAGDNTLLLATCDVKHEELPEEVSFFGRLYCLISNFGCHFTYALQIFYYLLATREDYRC